MAEKNNATCSICNKSYYVCMGCGNTRQLQPWKTYCCSPDCYKVFQVVKGFSTGMYAKDEFKSKLNNIDLSNLENFRESVKLVIKDALKEDKPVAKVVKEINPVEVVAETKAAKVEKVEEVKTEKAVEDVAKVEKPEKPENIVKPTVTRKRNYKVDAE